MAGTFWPRSELAEAEADRADSLFDEMLAGFEERWKPRPQVQPPASLAFDVDRGSLTPWADAATEMVRGAASAVGGFFDRDALMPWKSKPEPVMQSGVTPTATSPAAAQPPTMGVGAAVALPAASAYAPSSGRGEPGVERWSDLVTEAARAYNLPESTIKGLMEIESSGNPEAVSSAGAQGLMQVMPFHFKPGENPRDPRTNIMRGAKVYADALARWGDPDKAAAAYFGAIDDRGNITNATDGSSVDGPTYVRLWRQAAAKYGDAAPGAVPPSSAAPPPNAGAASPPAVPSPAAMQSPSPASPAGDAIPPMPTDGQDYVYVDLGRHGWKAWRTRSAAMSDPNVTIIHDPRQSRQPMADPLDAARSESGGLLMKAGEPVPMPEQASEDERRFQRFVEDERRQPSGLPQAPLKPQRNVVPFDPATQNVTDQAPDVLYRAPIEEQPADLPLADGGSAAPFDPDQGPREAIPGSVGATPYLGPLSPEPETVTPPAPAPAVHPSVAAPDGVTPPPPSPYAPGQAESMAPPPEHQMPPAADPWAGAGSAFGPGGIFEPAGGAPRLLERMEQIRRQAAAELGRNPIDQRVTDDPGWRARNPALAQEMDDLENQLGLVVAGQAGDASRFPRASRPTVEVLQEQLEAAGRQVRRAIGDGDEVAAAQAREQVARLESQYADAINARRAAEPAIESDIGRRIEQTPLDERTADDFATVGRERARVAPEDLSGPVSTVPNVNLNVTTGPVPAVRPDRLAQLNADIGSSLGSSVFGAGAGLAAPAETPEERLRNAQIGAGAGLVGGPLASRLLRRGQGGALASPGVSPGRDPLPSGLGNVPPSQVREPTLPGFDPPPGRSLADLADDMLGATADQAPIPRIRGEGGQLHLPGAPAHPTLIDRIGKTLEPWGRRVDIVRYAGMLSDTALHAMNATTNVPLQGVDLAATPIAATLDAGRAAVTRQPREVFFSEIPARLRGMWDIQVPVTQAGNRVGAKAGLDAAWEVLRTGLRPEDTAKLDRQTSGFGSGNAVVDFAVEYPLRVLGAADALFRSVAKGGHAAAEGYAAARKANGGAKPTPEQVRAALLDPDLLEKIDTLAARSVLQEDRLLTGWYRWAMNYQPKSDAGKLALAPAKAVASVLIPFVRTPYNIVAQGVGMTPAGYLGLVQDIAEGKAPREMAYRAARATIGTAAMVEGATAYANGELTGPYPEDAATRSTLPPGWQPWSRKVTLPDGSVRYVPLAYLGPLAVPYVATILAAETAKKGKAALSPEWAGAVALGIGRYAEQNTFFEGLATVSKVFDARTGEANLERIVEQVASQFSPHVIGGGALGREIQRITGQPLRDPEGALEALLATHPATAGRVPARRDVLGRELATSPGGVEAAVVRSTVERDAGVIRAFRQAGEGLPLQPPKQLRDPTLGGPRTLSRSQQIRWRRAFGDALNDAWANRGMPTDAATLKKIEDEARTVANETALGLR